jgi:metal-responsive CopG/Arc/MetJ family transcriptional regulator
MKNVQISVDDKLLGAVDKAARPLRLKRSQVIRMALRDWLRKRAIERFEREWIDTLGAHPDEASRAEEWGEAQIWSSR